MEKNDHTCGENCCGGSCGCSGDMPTITLTLEDDSELECNVLGTFDACNNEYIALAPIDDDEVMIYKFSEDDEGNISLALIECDEEFERASDAFYELFGEEEGED